MNNRQEVKLKRNKVVISVLKAHQPEVDTIPALKSKVTEFIDVNLQIESVHPQQANDAKGVTEGKNQLKDDVSDLGLVIAGALYSYGDSKDDTDLCNRMDLALTDFRRASVADFNKLCSEIISESRKAGTELAQYGPTPEVINNFADLAGQFKTASTKPREARIKKATATSTLEELFSIADDILLGHIDKLIIQFKASNSEFYKDFNNAKIIEDRGARATKEKTNEAASVQSA